MPMAGSLRRLSNQSLGKAKKAFLKPARGRPGRPRGARGGGSAGPAAAGEAAGAGGAVAALDVVHQLGIVGAPDYDSKEERLRQLLARLPGGCGSAAVIFASPCSLACVEAVLKDGPGAEDVHVVVASTSKAPQIPPRMQSNAGGCGACWCVINFDAPPSGAEYLQRLSCLHGAPATALKVAYSLLEERQLQGRPGRAVASVLRRARRDAISAGCAAGRKGGCFCMPDTGVKWGQGLRHLKIAEFDSALEQLEKDEEEEEEEEEDAEMDGDGCDCHLCASHSLASLSYHGAPAGRFAHGSVAGVEAVYLHLRAAEDLKALAPLIAPRMGGYAGTLICLHCLYNHTPWYGSEHVLADAGLPQPLRVVFVLAEATSWHEYPDSFTLWKGGAPWMDILDMESMNRTDKLLERLVDHEIELLGGCSERLVLMGTSQGGCQSMLRFLRSRRRLGGWVGSVTHFPTAPHVPRDWDPLLRAGEPLVNRERPVRLLAGERDVVFPPAVALRDAERLRRVGRFTDVEVEVQEGLQHEGFADDYQLAAEAAAAPQAAPGQASAASLRAMKEVPDLAFVRKHLATMIGVPVPSSPESC